MPTAGIRPRCVFFEVLSLPYIGMLQKLGMEKGHLFVFPLTITTLSSIACCVVIMSIFRASFKPELCNASSATYSTAVEGLREVGKK